MPMTMKLFLVLNMDSFKITKASTENYWMFIFFNSLPEIRMMAEEWMVDYNTECSHDSLGKLTPIEFKVSLSTV